jgi:hypothetical protein
MIIIIKNDAFFLYIKILTQETMSSKHCIQCYKDFIPRNKNCDRCTVCKKPNKCIHGTTKGRCKIDGCFGNEICEHKEHNQKCSICKPGVKELDNLNRIIRNIIKKLHDNHQNIEGIDKKFTKTHEKTKNFIIDLWKVDSFRSVIDICLQFITTYKEINGCHFNIDYYQIDHIIPKSKFNLTNKEEFNRCCSYNNLQILDKNENLKKSNK